MKNSYAICPKGHIIKINWYDSKPRCSSCCKRYPVKSFEDTSYPMEWKMK